MRTAAGWFAIVLFAGGVIVAVLWIAAAAEMESHFQKYANGASVLGLLFGLSGVAFAIWTLLQTQQIEQQAREEVRRAIEGAKAEIEKAREAIAQAEKEGQEVIRRIAALQLRVLCEQARQVLENGQIAIFQNYWKVAVEHLMRARPLCVRVAAFDCVTEDERGAFNVAGLNLDATIRGIGRTKGKVTGKPAAGKTEAATGEADEASDLVRPVAELLALVAMIEARVEQALFQVKYGT